MTGVVRPVEVQSAFASPAIVALASLFVIAYAMELAGLLDEAIRRVTQLCQRIGTAGPLGADRAWPARPRPFLNNTPIVVLSAPVVRDVAKSLGQSPKRYLIPLVLCRRARRLLHPDRHVDQPSGQRHGRGRRAAALRHLRDHAGRPRRSRSPAGSTCSCSANGWSRRATRRRPAGVDEATREAEDFREPGLAGGLVGSAQPFAKQVQLQTGRGHHLVARVRRRGRAWRRSTSRRSPPAPSPARCC